MKTPVPKFSRRRDCVVMRKIGKFYNSFDDDAYVILGIMNYKVVNGRAGFPVESLYKVCNELINHHVNYVVITNGEEDKENVGKFSDNNYRKYYELGKKKSTIVKENDKIVSDIRKLSTKQLAMVVKYIEEISNEPR